MKKTTNCQTGRSAISSFGSTLRVRCSIVALKSRDEAAIALRSSKESGGDTIYRMVLFLAIRTRCSCPWNHGFAKLRSISTLGNWARFLEQSKKPPWKSSAPKSWRGAAPTAWWCLPTQRTYCWQFVCLQSPRKAATAAALTQRLNTRTGTKTG